MRSWGVLLVAGMMIALPPAAALVGPAWNDGGSGRDAGPDRPSAVRIGEGSTRGALFHELDTQDTYVFEPGAGSRILVQVISAWSIGATLLDPNDVWRSSSANRGQPASPTAHAVPAGDWLLRINLHPSSGFRAAVPYEIRLSSEPADTLTTQIGEGSAVSFVLSVPAGTVGHFQHIVGFEGTPDGAGFQSFDYLEARWPDGCFGSLWTERALSLPTAPILAVRGNPAPNLTLSATQPFVGTFGFFGQIPGPIDLVGVTAFSGGTRGVTTVEWVGEPGEVSMPGGSRAEFVPLRDFAGGASATTPVALAGVELSRTFDVGSFGMVRVDAAVLGASRVVVDPPNDEPTQVNSSKLWAPWSPALAGPWRVDVEHYGGVAEDPVLAVASTFGVPRLCNFD